MEQLQQLIDLLKQTPEMALWGLVIWCVFILLKLASWIYAFKVVSQQLIKRLFDWKIKKSEDELSKKELSTIQNYIERNTISGTKTHLFDLLRELKNLGVRIKSQYVHDTDFIKAIEIIKEYKQTNNR